jgi:hypothetical protein
MYIITMAIGIGLWVWLFWTYLAILPAPVGAQCTFLKDGLCATFSADPFSIIITFWTALQLVWVTMLLTVQLLQVARGLTTYEAMNPNKPRGPINQAAMSFVATGDVSMSSAQVDAGGRGPDPTGERPHNHAHHSALDAWKRLLGIDTFMAVVGGGGSQRQRTAVNRNPFSKGCFTNCADFWADDTPIFGSRETGQAKFGGERVDYHSMYEVPAGAGYVAVHGDDHV